MSTRLSTVYEYDLQSSSQSCPQSCLTFLLLVRRQGNSRYKIVLLNDYQYLEHAN